MGRELVVVAGRSISNTSCPAPAAAPLPKPSFPGGPLPPPPSYVYQGHYDCHGYYWVYAAHRLVVCLGVMAAFTSGGCRPRERADVLAGLQGSAGRCCPQAAPSGNQ